MKQPTATSEDPAKAAEDRPRRLSRWKKLGFAAVTVLLFFVTLEAILWLCGVRPLTDTRDPFVGFAGYTPLFVESDEQFVTAENKLAWFNPQQFPRAKPTGTYRIFCLGGSTTYGRPYDDITSFPGWMRELLREVAPDGRWEVINAGGISYASYRVAAVMEELVDYQPDLFVIYTGHNEFLEERTYRDIREMPALQRNLVAGLANTRTYTVIHHLLSGDDDAKRFELPADVDEMLEGTVGPTSYQRDDRLRQAVLRHFEINLHRMVRIARAHEAGVLLVVPASNKKDCSPFKSQHSSGLSSKDAKRFNVLLEDGRSLVADKPAAALKAFRQAEEIDGRFAELHYRLGRALFALGQFDEAEAAFQKAIEEDVCPLRSLGEIGDSTRRVASDLGVPLVDFERHLAERCRVQHDHPLPGREYFLDHVHPTIEANGWLARAIIDKLIHARRIPVTTPVHSAHLSRAKKRIDARVDPKAHAVALRNLAKVLNWAGKHYEAGRLALDAVEKLPDDSEALVLSAEFLRQTGRVEQAIEHCQRALRKLPASSDHREKVHQLLGPMLVDGRRFEEAKRHFLELTRLRPKDAQAWQMVGAILLEQQRYAEALPPLREALRRDSDDANIHYNLALALTHLKDHQQAIHHYRQAVRINPDDADAHINLGVQLLDQGQAKEAARHFDEALRIRPDDAMAKKLLGDAVQ